MGAAESLQNICFCILPVPNVRNFCRGQRVPTAMLLPEEHKSYMDWKATAIRRRMTKLQYIPQGRIKQGKKIHLSVCRILSFSLILLSDSKYI